MKMASVERSALSTIAPMIINVIMANNVAMESARGALILLLVLLLRLVGVKAKL